MKANSKLFVLLLVLAMLCGILAVTASADTVANPDGVTDYLAIKTGNAENAGAPASDSTETLYTHISDTGNAYYRQFYSNEAASNKNQNTFYNNLNNYFSDYNDSYLTLEFDFSTETHFDSKTATSVVFLMRGSGPADTVGIYFGYSETDGNYVKLTGGDNVVIEDLKPYEWHHVTLILQPKNVVIDETNLITSDAESRAVLYLDGKKVAERTGGIFPTQRKNLEGVRIQTGNSASNREKGDLCLDNLVAKRVTSAYEGDLSAVMEGTANLGNYPGLFTWNDDSYAFPDGVRLMAKIGDVNYSDAQAAVDAATEGDTVTLYEPIFSSHALRVDKNMTVDTRGLTFSYSAPDYVVTQNGNLYTFTRVENPAKVTVTVDGKTVEASDFVNGRAPASLTAATVLVPDDRSLYKVTSWKMTIDGAEAEYTATVTEEMYGKEIVYTADSFTRIAMIYTDASKVDHYIPYVDGATAAKAFLEFFNYSTTQTYPVGDETEGTMKFVGEDRLTLACDIITATGIAGFGTNGQRNCVLDLNGHELRYTASSGTMFPQFRTQNNFYLISSTPGARIVAESGNPTLFTLWGAARVYIGNFLDADGDNISVYNFKVGYVGSSLLEIRGGHFSLLRGGQFFENGGNGSFQMTESKIYLGESETNFA